MALIKCNECGGTVSTKAAVCPHCGCPVSEEESTMCVIEGVPYDLREVLEIAKEGNTVGARIRGCQKIYEITGSIVGCELWREIVQAQKIPSTYLTYSEEKELEKQNNIPKCPTCGSTNIVKYGVGARTVSGFVFGRLSVEGRAQWQCKNCGYMW